MKTPFASEAKILACIAENQGISEKEICDKLNQYCYQTIHNRITWMRKNKFISSYLTHKRESRNIRFYIDWKKMFLDIQKNLIKRKIQFKIPKEDMLYPAFYGVVEAQNTKERNT